jgi:hypothetical protein
VIIVLLALGHWIVRRQTSREAEAADRVSGSERP